MSKQVLPPEERNFIVEAAESGFFADEELQALAANLSTQVVSLGSLVEQERILEETNALIDRHAAMLLKYPETFNYLKKRQAAQTQRLQQLRDKLTLKMNGKSAESDVSFGSRVSKAASRTPDDGSDIPAFRSLKTPRMGGGLT